MPNKFISRAEFEREFRDSYRQNLQEVERLQTVDRQHTRLLAALTTLEQTWRREYYDTVRADELAAILKEFRSTSLGGG